MEQGDIVYIEKADVEPTEVKFDLWFSLLARRVLVKVGAPVVEGATVTAKVIKNGKGKKLNIITIAQRRQCRRMGHRQPFTKAEITAING